MGREARGREWEGAIGALTTAGSLLMLARFLIAEIKPSISRMAQLVGGKVSQRAVPDVEHPHGLASLIDFVENPVNVSSLTEEEATDLTLCDLGFARKGAAVGQLLERV